MPAARAGQIKERQQKALLRMFPEGPEGFKGSLSAGKYSAITGGPIANDLTAQVGALDKNVGPAALGPKLIV